MANVAEIIIRARDEATAVLQKVAGSSSALNGAIARIGASAGALGTVASTAALAGGAVLAMGRQFADQVETLERLSDATGVSTQNIQILQAEFKKAGLESSDATNALTFLARAIGRNDPLLAQLGIRTRDVHEAMLQVSDAFTKSKDAAFKQNAAIKLLGRSSSEAAGVMSGLREKLQGTQAEMLRAGAIITDDLKPAARELDEQLDKLGITWQGVWTRAAATLAPAAVAIMDYLARITTAVQKLADLPAIKFVAKLGFEQLTRDAATVVNAIKLVLAAAQSLNALKFEGVAGVKRAFEANIKAAFEKPAAAPGTPGTPGSGGSGTVVDPERLKRIQELARVLQLTEKAAGAVLAKLEEVELAKQRASLVEVQIKAGTLVGREAIVREIALVEDAARRASLTEIAVKAQGLGGKDDLLAEIEQVAQMRDTVSRVQLAIRAGKIQGAEQLAAQLAALDSEIARDRLITVAIKTGKLTEEQVGEALIPARAIEQEIAAGFEMAKLRVKQAPKLQVSDLVDGPEDPQLDPTTLLFQQWADAADSILDSTGRVGAGLQAVFDGLTSGFQNAFQGIVTGAMGLGDALVAIFKSVGDAIIDMLARIAAAALFKGILKLAGLALGVPTFLPFPGVNGGVGDFGASQVGSRNLQASAQPGHTFNLYMQDARDLVLDLTQPGGGARAARDTMRVLQSY